VRSFPRASELSLEAKDKENRTEEKNARQGKKEREGKK